MFPLPEPADLVIVSHFTFDDISKDITTLETKLKGTSNFTGVCTIREYLAKKISCAKYSVIVHTSLLYNCCACRL